MNLKSNERDLLKILNEDLIAKELQRKLKFPHRLFCPPFMCRFDINPRQFEYKTVWLCKICSKVLLSKDAAINHSNNCKLKLTKEKNIPAAELAEMEKNMCYPCKYCIHNLQSKVSWLRHLNIHETPNYDISTWGVDLPEDEKK